MRQTIKIKVTHTITDTEYEVLKAMIEGIGVSYNVDAVAGLEGNTLNEYWTMIELNSLYHKGLIDRSHHNNCSSIYSLKNGVEIEL